MNKEEIKKILPHREPMLLVDEVELIDGVAHGKCHIRGDEYFLQGHFPGNPVVCLLYTSPSPRDLSTSRMPSSA